MISALTSPQLVALAGGCTCFLAWALECLGVGLPGPAWVGEAAFWASLALGALAVSPWLAVVVGGVGVGRTKQVRDSGLPKRSPVDEVPTSHEAEEHVDEVAGDVDGEVPDGNIGDYLEDVTREH